MQILRRLASFIEAFNGRWAIFVSFFIIPIMVILVTEVVTRYIFNSPTVWANQLAILIFGGFIIMGGAYTLMNNGHVRMDLIYNRLPSDRARAILDTITSTLFFLFCGVLLYKAVPYCWQATLSNRHVEGMVWRVVIWPTYWTLPLATFLLLLEGIIRFARDLRSATRGDQRP